MHCMGRVMNKRIKYATLTINRRQYETEMYILKCISILIYISWNKVYSRVPYSCMHLIACMYSQINMDGEIKKIILFIEKMYGM